MFIIFPILSYKTQDIAYSLVMNNLIITPIPPEFQNLINTNNNEEGIQC